MKLKRIILVAVLCVWLASMLAACSGGVQNQIVGRWNEVTTGIEFDIQAGGAMTINVLFSINGTYTFVDADTIQIEFNGVLDLLGSQTFDVAIANGVMTWTSGSLLLTFNKVSQ